MGGGAWPFLVGGLICLVNSDNERDHNPLNSGVLGRAYAGLSSDKTGEKPVRRKPKGSWVKCTFPGLVGPLAEAERRR